MLVNGDPGNLISIRDRGLLYGDGVFRTLRASQGHAAGWPLHFEKLRHDCAALGITCPDFNLLSSELETLLLSHPDGVVKLIVTRGSGERGYAPALTPPPPTRLWDISPTPVYPAEWAKLGIKARVCQLRLGHQPRLAGVKHLNRLENVLAAAESSDSGIGEGLLLDVEGHVIEGTRSNLFLVSGGELITPRLSACGVAGVQRDRVMDWAARHGMQVRVREVLLDELLMADEVFLVNSIIALWPIRELEQRRWTTFPVSHRIRQYLEGHNETQ
ncbi:MAG TPA: aminodeoxychorismate lyase [Gallionella sp.]